MKIQNKRTAITIFLFTFMALFAISGSMFSILLPYIISAYQLDLQQASYFSIFQGSGSLIALGIAGAFADRLSKGHLIGVAIVLYGACIILIGTAPAFIILLIVWALVGLFSGLLNQLSTAFISDLYENKRARYVNLLHMVFGLGSLLGPQYPKLMSYKATTWNHTYFVLGSTALVLGICYAIFILYSQFRTPNKKIYKTAARKDNLPLRQVIKAPGIRLVCVIAFLMMGNQGVLSVWIPTYLTKINPLLYTTEYSVIVMTIYWLGMACSRLLSSYFSQIFSAKRMIFLGSSMGTAFLALALLVQSPLGWIIFLFCIGLSTGAIYPLIFVVAFELFPAYSASASSIVSLFSSCGSMFFVWLVGNAAEKIGFLLTMWIPVLCILGVTLSAALVLYGKQEKKSVNPLRNTDG